VLILNFSLQFCILLFELCINFFLCVLCVSAVKMAVFFITALYNQRARMPLLATRICKTFDTLRKLFAGRVLRRKYFAVLHIFLVLRCHDKICHMFGDAIYPGLGKVLRLALAGRLTLAVFISVWFSQCTANRGLAAGGSLEPLSPQRRRGRGDKKEKSPETFYHRGTEDTEIRKRKEIFLF